MIVIRVRSISDEWININVVRTCSLFFSSLSLINICSRTDFFFMLLSIFHVAWRIHFRKSKTKRTMLTAEQIHRVCSTFSIDCVLSMFESSTDKTGILLLNNCWLSTIVKHWNWLHIEWSRIGKLKMSRSYNAKIKKWSIVPIKYHFLLKTMPSILVQVCIWFLFVIANIYICMKNVTR
jgi:hypothetical protein